jgi:outer membrane protein OmpA-like peptidoglycan-associated protein
VISTNKIHFQFNRSVILPSSHSVIDEILAGIQGRSDVEGVRIEGHTDGVGSDAYNQHLSENRAASVRQYMVGKGYPADKITAVGMGEGSPVADNATKAGRAQNRRVEFHLQLKPGAKVKIQEKASGPTYEEGDTAPEGR